MKRRLPAFLLLALIVVSPVGGAELGRLFSTPEERLQLDRLRAENRPRSPREKENAAPQPPRPEQLFLDGLVRRPRGGEVVWINGERNRGNTATAGVRILEGPDRENRVTLEIEGAERSAVLKPGQRWEPASGQVSEGRPNREPTVPLQEREEGSAAQGEG